MIGGSPLGPWYWPFIRWIPAVDQARILGQRQAYTQMTVFFRRKAASSVSDNPQFRVVFDLWADQFEAMEKIVAKESTGIDVAEGA